MLVGLKRELRNTERRLTRAYDSRWSPLGDACTKCGHRSRGQPTQATLDKCKLERALEDKQAAMIWKIQAWLRLVREYTKGEPKI